VGAVAELIDKGNGKSEYSGAVGSQAELVRHPGATPSARILDDMRTEGIGFFAFALAAAQGHKEYFAELEPLPEERERIFAQEASESLQRQKQIEAADTISLDRYLEKYFSTD